jgi:two-component system, NtrC family, sensor histidine kinase KinB
MGETMMPENDTRASLELLLNISRELATTLDLRTVLARVLNLSLSNVHADRGSLVALDEDGNPVEAAIVYGNQLHPHTIEQLQSVVDQGLAGWVIQNRKPVLINDTSQDERWLRRPDDAAERTGPKSAICVPLMARDTLVGILTIVQSEPGCFNEDHLALAQAIADLAGIAIRNAQLYSSLDMAHQRYYELFEDSIDPIIITDWKGHILEANRQAVATVGYNPLELQKMTIYQLHEVRMDKLGEEFSFLKNQHGVSYESDLLRFSKSSLPVEVHVRKFFFGSAENLQWIFRNISERKELDRLREDLTAMIYHDLRSPLSNIISSLDILNVMLPQDSNPSIKSVMQIATRSTDRMQRLISSLLDINRLESGQAITNRKVTDIHTLVNESVEAVQNITDSKQQKVIVHLEDNLPSISVDADMIRRVLINLLENATKYSPSNGTVEVGSSFKDQMVSIWVEDSGPGIPDEAKDIIFDKFTRLKVEHAPKGLGLGLAFCRLAVQAHGGKIWVESKFGEGSRFIFTLPVLQETL